MKLSASTPSSNAPGTPKEGWDQRSWGQRFERRLWRLRKSVAQRRRAVQDRQVVFVAGMQRSGTNMLMDLLEWSRWTDVFHETDARAFDNFQMRPRGVIRELVSHSPAPRVVIKSLCELDQIRSLMEEFAPAKTLWIIRGYDDTVRSATRSFGQFANQVHRLAVDTAAAEWRGRGMSAQTQQVLRDVDHPEMTDISGAALMWYYRNVLFFEQGLDRDPRVKLIRYEDLVSDPSRVLKEAFAFLDIADWSPWISRHVHVKSVGRQRRMPIEDPIRRVCDDLMSRFDSIIPPRATDV